MLSPPVREDKRSMRERVVALLGTKREGAERMRRRRWVICFSEEVGGSGRARSWLSSLVSALRGVSIRAIAETGSVVTTSELWIGGRHEQRDQWLGISSLAESGTEHG